MEEWEEQLMGGEEEVEVEEVGGWKKGRTAGAAKRERGEGVVTTVQGRIWTGGRRMTVSNN
jgi:hypothetical protein